VRRNAGLQVAGVDAARVLNAQCAPSLRPAAGICRCDRWLGVASVDLPGASNLAAASDCAIAYSIRDSSRGDGFAVPRWNVTDVPP